MTTSNIPPAIPADRETLDTSAGRLNCYVSGTGPTLLLFHSINAAGSAYEVRPIFEHYRERRRVVAVDLPGFGFSERSDRRYDIALYTDAVRATAAHYRSDADGPVDALALSLSSEFLARAARDDQAQAAPNFGRLCFVTPTGFRRSDVAMTGPDGASREIAWLSGFLKLGLVGEPLFRLLTRPGTIRYFLKRTWGSAHIDRGLADYDALITRQHGAHFAPLAFISGRLFSRDIRRVYEALTHDVFLGHGTRGDFRDFRGADWTEARANWTTVAFQTGALPHFEAPDTFFAELDRFLSA